MLSLIASASQYVRENDFKTIIARFNGRDVHPAIQFIKYALSGAVSTIVFAVVYLVISHLNPGNPAAGAGEKFRETLLPTLVAFGFANVVVYWLNTRWVFTPGRHSLIREFLFFTLVNMPGAIGGTLVQGLLVSEFGWSRPAAIIGFLVPNILINYVCRKFFIFKK